MACGLVGGVTVTASNYSRREVASLACMFDSRPFLYHYVTTLNKLLTYMYLHHQVAVEFGIAFWPQSDDALWLGITAGLAASIMASCRRVDCPKTQLVSSTFTFISS